MTDITVNRESVIEFNKDGITISTEGDVQITNEAAVPFADFNAGLTVLGAQMDGAINQIRKTVLHNARQMELLNTLSQNGIVLEDVIRLLAMFVPSVNSDVTNNNTKERLIDFMQHHCERPEEDIETYKAADDFINLAYAMKAIVEN